MGFWNNLFRRMRATTAATGDSRTQQTSASTECPFCGTPRVEWDTTAPYANPIWRCHCGAFASGSWPPDFDEVCDQVLTVLKIDARASEPEEETGHPSVTMQRYDTLRASDAVADILTMHGYDSRITRIAVPTSTFVDIMSQHGSTFHVTSKVCDVLLLWAKDQARSVYRGEPHA